MLQIRLLGLHFLPVLLELHRLATRAIRNRLRLLFCLGLVRPRGRVRTIHLDLLPHHERGPAKHCLCLTHDFLLLTHTLQLVRASLICRLVEADRVGHGAASQLTQRLRVQIVGRWLRE